METTKKLKPVMVVAAAAILAFGATQAQANGSASVTATAAIQNAISVTEVQPINFGQVAVSIRGASSATAVLAHATQTVTYDSVNDATSRMLFVPGGDAITAGRFNISGTPPSTVLNVSYTPAPIACIDAGCAGSPDFTFAVTPGTTDNAPGGNITTNGSGAVQLQVGGTLTTATTGVYGDGTYRGNLTVSVNY